MEIDASLYSHNEMGELVPDISGEEIWDLLDEDGTVVDQLIFNGDLSNSIQEEINREILDDLRKACPDPSKIDERWLPPANEEIPFQSIRPKDAQVETLPGADKLGEVADMAYFKNRLIQQLNVPKSTGFEHLHWDSYEILDDYAGRFLASKGCPWTAEDTARLAGFNSLEELKIAACQDVRIARSCERMGIKVDVDWQEISREFYG